MDELTDFLRELSGVLRTERSRRDIEKELTRILGVHPLAVCRIDRIKGGILQFTCCGGGKATFKDFYDSRDLRDDVIRPLCKLNPDLAVRI